MWQGRRAVATYTLIALVAAVGIGLAIYVVVTNRNATTALDQTLPQMVSDYGANARIVKLDVADDDIGYDVVLPNGSLHHRRYLLSGENRQTDDFTATANGSQLRSARLRLSAIPQRVLDTLLKRVAAPVDSSLWSATLTGQTWTIKTGAATWQARYDGTGLHQLS
jgi:hypothetical protein